MNTYYKSDLKKSYLILEGGEAQREDYQVVMLRENQIPGLLNTDIRFVDNRMNFHYEISGYTSLLALHEKAKLSYEEILQIVRALLCTVQNLQNYMLDVNHLLLDPEFIFCKKDSMAFCYYPVCTEEIPYSFRKLAEYFVREVDYQDEKGAHLAYTLHRETMEKHYSIEEILEKFTEEETEPVLDYVECMEETDLEDSMIAEKADMWDTIRRLLDRKKKNKSL